MVRLFGEEAGFWASLIKVIMLVTFLITGLPRFGRYARSTARDRVSLWSSHGGIVPFGLLPIVLWSHLRVSTPQ